MSPHPRIRSQVSILNVYKCQRLVIYYSPGSNFCWKTLWDCSNYESCYESSIKKLCWPGAIIGDWDRKSWDAPRPMIWDNFSVFRTNCAILTSFIRAAPRTCRGFSRGCCHVAWSKIVRVASFHSDGRELSNKAGKKNQGSSMHFYTLS